MRTPAPFLAALACALPAWSQAPAPAAPPAAGRAAAPGHISLSIREADLKDLLRAATEGTNST